ncbi:unnamed protein product [Anisakis simplex]|uniref:Uncharacterized protein n=1 Tax=Anisakis simplex TaxID=6269 RepID=A0A0M3K693_ANISI|nr:unnamed protein product [Anisakis simplex]
MLQNHLDECIETVRAKSPEGLQRNGRLMENGQDEEESEATNNTSSQRTVIESPQIRGHHPNRISTVTTDSTVSSIEFDMRAGAMHPNEAECRKLKSLVQYQC